MWQPASSGIHIVYFGSREPTLKRVYKVKSLYIYSFRNFSWLNYIIIYLYASMQCVRSSYPKSLFGRYLRGGVFLLCLTWIYHLSVKNKVLATLGISWHLSLKALPYLYRWQISLETSQNFFIFYATGNVRFGWLCKLPFPRNFYSMDSTPLLLEVISHHIPVCAKCLKFCCCMYSSLWTRHKTQIKNKNVCGIQKQTAM